VRAIDVLHLGRERAICCWQVDDVLVDPGPGSCLETLLAELGAWRPRALLLTHIHLDHAGAAGALARRWPELEVLVHERGAPHLAAPDRLIESARRLYGDRMDELWGAIEPVPAERLRVVRGGERVLGFRVADTPGHASHHVAYLHEATGRAFVGDVGGVRIPPADFTVPPTPPPDIDVDAWHQSLATIAAWRPSSLGLTHFGAVEEVDAQLAAVGERLDRWAELARRLDEERFVAHVRAEIGAATDPATALVYEQTSPPHQLWQGLDRYWRKRPGRAGHAELSSPA